MLPGETHELGDYDTDHHRRNAEDAVVSLLRTGSPSPFILVLLAFGVAILFVSCSQGDGQEPSELEELVARSDDVMNSLSSFRAEYDEVPNDVPGADGRPKELVTVVRPDSQCSVLPGRSGQILNEVIDIGSQRWVRPPIAGAQDAWTLTDRYFGVPKPEFANLPRDPVNDSGVPTPIGPVEFRQGGEETIDGRKASIVSSEYTLGGIEGPIDFMTTLWIDQETSHLLRKEVTDNDRYGSHSTRVWVYYDFDVDFSIESPESLLTSSPQLVGVPCGFDLTDNVVLDVSMEKDDFYRETYLVGEPVAVTARVQQGDKLLRGADVSAYFLAPGQDSIEISFNDAGEDGDPAANDGSYTYVLTSTEQCGTYSFEVSALVTANGERFLREIGKLALVRSLEGTGRDPCG